MPEMMESVRPKIIMQAPCCAMAEESENMQLAEDFISCQISIVLSDLKIKQSK